MSLERRRANHAAVYPRRIPSNDGCGTGVTCAEDLGAGWRSVGLPTPISHPASDPTDTGVRRLAGEVPDYLSVRGAIW